MSAPSYYAWGAEWMPLAIHLNTRLIADLNVAIATGLRLQPDRGEEIGGILLGRIENPAPDHPVVYVERFDPVESEHRRGPSYDLSERDKRVLARKLAWWNSHGQKENLRPVGFFRSHTRRGLYLDNDDRLLLENYFPEVYAVVLLVRPEPAGGSVGGFFFWDEGDMHRESSFQEFPFNPAKLPVVSPAAASVEPVMPAVKSAAPVAPSPAEPAAKPVVPPPAPMPALDVTLAPAPPRSAEPMAGMPRETRPGAPAAPRRMAPLPPPAVRPASTWARMAIPVAGGVILGAIVYGLVTRGASHVPVPPSAAVRKPAPTANPPAAKPAPAVAAVAPAQSPAAAPTAPIEKPSPFLPKARQVAKAQSPARAVQPPQPVPSPTGSASRNAAPASATVVVPNSTETAPAVAAAPTPPPETLAPITTPVRIEQPRRPARHATVTVEPVSGSKLGRMVGHIPGLGRLGKRNKGFVPARPIRQITPTVPVDEHLARDVPVDVKVTVDPAGNVASVDSHGGNGELARLAVEAARNWQFVPARHNDETVSSELILHFTFKGSSAHP